MSEDLNTKSLGEKLHDAQSRGVDGPSWFDYSPSERAWTEKVAVVFAASLSHDETASAVITDLLSRLQAAEERAAVYREYCEADDDVRRVGRLNSTPDQDHRLNLARQAFAALKTEGA